ncbi:MAG: hypothetical protein NUV98_02770 [Candidatus Roizmanbacteria bacterium]|nr:hypothetical protein [Candidatus Roizmanbacteria bacterium]
MGEKLGPCIEIGSTVKPKTVKGAPELMVIDGEVWNPSGETTVDPGIVSELKIREAVMSADAEVLPYREG